MALRLTLLLLLAVFAAPAFAVDGEICHADAPLLSHATLGAMEEAEGKYARIVASGGWASVPMTSMQANDVSPAVKLLRLRLMREGDLSAKTKLSNRFDNEVADALKRLQARYGLPETGILDQYTLRTINVPAAERLAWLRANVAHLRGLLAEMPVAARRVTVNIPAAEVEAIEGRDVAGRYVAVAGSAEHPSPEVETKIVAVNFNPTWTVPTHIVKNDLVEQMSLDPAYLRRAGFSVFDPRGRKVDPANINRSEALRYTYRQAAGPANPLGTVRLNMPNSESVYMHDTPRQTLFGRGIRFLSAGCVRVQNIGELAAWLLRGDSKDHRNGARDVALAEAVPVSWVYMPAWSTPEGVTCFRPDIYGRMAGSAKPVANSIALK